MPQFFRSAVLAAALLAGVTQPLGAQERSAALAQMLQSLPESMAAEVEGRFPEIYFGDPVAARTVIELVHTQQLVNAVIGKASPPFLMDYAEPLGPLLRTATPDLGQAAYGAGANGWVGILGFAAGDIRQLLVVQNPPMSAMLFRLDPSLMSGIGQVLVANGYGRIELGKDAAFARGDADYGMDMGARNPLDPFGGNLGRASRVALVPEGLVLQSPGTPELRQMTDSASAKLGSHAMIQGLLAALDDAAAGNGPILRAIVFTAPDLLGVTETPPPGIRMAVLADLSDGTSVHATLALAYDTRAEAEAAASDIAARWSAVSSTRNDASFADITGQSPVLTVLGDAPAVVLLTLSGEASFESFASTDMNAPFDLLLSAWLSRDMVFLPQG